ncbi:helix-turn-helix domain-containing protein [Nocardia salmonicida]|uniref:helix-turn-helix domain-containing protein n=1 Tax=Nocardia salmonicida TaxID=53431 RepID=UPI0037BB9757
MTVTPESVGSMVRRWRQDRRLSQLDLALGAGTSTRHLSFIENDRATPSPAMLARLGEHLDLPLRDRDRLLLAAGFAPVHGVPELDSAEMTPIRDAVRQILDGYAPFPAIAVDGDWTMVDANAGVWVFLEGVGSEILTPPINALRLTLHPRGLAPRIANLAQWRGHVLGRLIGQIAATGSAGLADLYTELAAYPGGRAEPDQHSPVVPLRLRHGDHELVMLSATTVFGAPHNVTTAELAIESFLPADPETRTILSGRH